MLIFRPDVRRRSSTGTRATLSFGLASPKPSRRRREPRIHDAELVNRCCVAVFGCGDQPQSASQYAGRSGRSLTASTHGTAVSEGGVKIHYASLGKGRLVVMIHGFPASCRTRRATRSTRSHRPSRSWRSIASRLQRSRRASRNYDHALPRGDVAAVIRHLAPDRATIVGHDWVASSPGSSHRPAVTTETW